jgi:hypothetical protein
MVGGLQGSVCAAAPTCGCMNGACTTCGLLGMGCCPGGLCQKVSNDTYCEPSLGQCTFPL